MLLLIATAFGAEVTDMPPMLRGDLTLDYEGSYQFGSIEEQGATYGKRRVQRHDLNYNLAFAPIDGIALTLGIPTTPSVTYSYPGAVEMIYEPVTEGGTYQFGAPLATEPSFRGKGLNGIWMGLALAPFSERYRFKQQVTWRIDLAYRTKSKNTLWTTGGNETRGAAPGGQAFKIEAAFSTDKQRTNPYMHFLWISEGKTTVDVVDEQGNAWVNGLEVRAPSSIDVRGGTEIVSYTDSDDESRVAVDLFLRFGYRSWGDVPSGLFLPDVLNASRTIAVSVGDHLRAGTGLGIDGHISKYVGIRAGFDATYISPHRLEHVYEARTGADTVELGWSFRLQGRIR